MTMAVVIVESAHSDHAAARRDKNSSPSGKVLLQQASLRRMSLKGLLKVLHRGSLPKASLPRGSLPRGSLPKDSSPKGPLPRAVVSRTPLRKVIVKEFLAICSFLKTCVAKVFPGIFHSKRPSSGKARFGNFSSGTPVRKLHLGNTSSRTSLKKLHRRNPASNDGPVITSFAPTPRKTISKATQPYRRMQSYTSGHHLSCRAACISRRPFPNVGLPEGHAPKAYFTTTAIQEKRSKTATKRETHRYCHD